MLVVFLFFWVGVVVIFQGYFEWFPLECMVFCLCDGYRVVSYKEWNGVFFGVMVVSILFIVCP